MPSCILAWFDTPSLSSHVSIPSPFPPSTVCRLPQTHQTSGSIAKADNSGTAVTTSAGTLKSTSLERCRGAVCPTISSLYDSRDPDTKGACYRETSSHLSTRFQNDLSWREKNERFHQSADNIDKPSKPNGMKLATCDVQKDTCKSSSNSKIYQQKKT